MCLFDVIVCFVYELWCVDVWCLFVCGWACVVCVDGLSLSLSVRVCVLSLLCFNVFVCFCPCVLA